VKGKVNGVSLLANGKKLTATVNGEELAANGKKLTTTLNGEELIIHVPAAATDTIDTVIKLELSGGGTTAKR